MQTFLNQLVYFGFFQSLLLLFIYLFSKKSRRSINGYLVFLIGILSVGLAGKVLHSFGAWNGNFRLISLSEFSILLFGPTIYLFVRSILKRKPFSRKDLAHYIPALVYSCFILIYFIIPTDQVLGERIKTGELTRVIYACLTVGLVVNCTYWVLAWQGYRNFSVDIQNEVSYELHTRFIRNFLWVTGGCLFLWIGIYIISLFGFDMLERNTRPYIWLVLTLVVLFITYYGMVSPQVMQVVPDITSRKYTQSKLSASDLDHLKEELNTLMLEKKPYLNSKLLKAELAEMLGVNNPELARLLNENIGMNFFEYVNYYRIKEFVDLAKTEKAQQLTFFGLAQEAGFHSKTTFNKSFKKLMGTSPSDYFKKPL